MIGLEKEEEAAVNKNGKSRGREQSAQKQLILPLRGLARAALWDTVVISGLAFVEEEMEAERAALCGPRYAHLAERQAQRSGHVPSSLVFSMVVVALIAAGCVSSAPESASHTIAPEPTSNTIKTDGLYRAKTDAPISETHDELVTAAYEYDGGHTPVSGCTALAKGEEVKVLAPKVAGDLNAVQVNTQGHIGWTKSYYLDEPAVKS